VSRKQFDRRQPSRNIAQTILIVCEGQKTEPLYFKGIRDHRRLRTLKVKIFDAGKTDPASIINRAIEERQKIKEVGSWEPGDAAWAVLDGDEHKERDINNWRKALTIAETQKINLAITNPCCSRLPELVQMLLTLH
jgi:hypothetical protein